MSNPLLRGRNHTQKHKLQGVGVKEGQANPAKEQPTMKVIETILDVVKELPKQQPNSIVEPTEQSPIYRAEESLQSEKTVILNESHDKYSDGVREGPSSSSLVLSEDTSVKPSTSATIQNPQIHDSIDDEEDSSSDQEDLDQMFVQYDSSINRCNEGASRKILTVLNDIGKDEDRIMRAVIKRMCLRTKRDAVVHSVDEVRVLIDSYYPRVKLMFKLNNEPRTSNILHLYKVVHDPRARNIITRIFAENFNWLSKQACRKLFPIVKFRADYTKQKFVGGIDELIESGVARTLVAVYSIIPNCTIQFVFVDIHYGEVSFDNFFIERYRNDFKEAYAFYEKTMKPRLLLDSTGMIVDTKVEEAGLAIDNEEADSDDDKCKPQSAPMNFETIRQKVLELLKEDLETYQDQINEKIQQKQRLMEQYDYNLDQDSNLFQERIQDIDLRIEQMENALATYKAARSELANRFHSIDSAPARKVTQEQKKTKMGLLFKHLRILKNQLVSELPIVHKKKELFDKLKDSNLLILVGETGSGKSTQLPQLLCEFYKVFQQENVKPIVLTQPRKIATRTLAERIAEEMGETLHQFVSYEARTKNSDYLNQKTRILVKLDRLLLDELQRDPLLSNYSCLVIDEAHERTISIDIIVGFLTSILQKRKDFKVIITSATLDSKLFENHFKNKKLKVNAFKVEGRKYHVNVIYKNYPEEEAIHNKIFKCLTEEILDRSSLKSNYKGHVLCFCTGIEQIHRLCDQTKAYLLTHNLIDYCVLPLHGRLSSEEQGLVFSPSPGQFKIIFTTRIAETAITINGVKVVIDPGQDRLNSYDQSRRMSLFQMGTISKSAAQQRSGRAGRTSEGYCFRLYNEDMEKDMPLNKTPEIESAPLDTLVLRLKAMKIKDLKSFEYLSAPNDENLDSSEESMKLIGCLSQQSEITPIGRAILGIPIEPFLSRAIIDGMIVEKLSLTQKVVEKIVRILAIIANSQSVFYSSEDTREICEKAKFNGFAEAEGDFFSLLNVYEAYENQLLRGKQRLNSFLREHFLNKKALQQAKELCDEIMTVVGRTVLNTNDFQDCAKEVEGKIRTFPDTKDLILSCLLTSFCQNLCLFSQDGEIGYTMLTSRQPIQIHQSSFLTLQGITPKWIVCYDITKSSSQTYCRVAQEVSFDLLKASVSQKVFHKLRLAECEKSNPFYVRFERSLTTAVFRTLQYRNLEHNLDETVPQFQNMKIVFDRESNKVRVFFSEEKTASIQKFDDYVEKLRQELVIKTLLHSFSDSTTAEMTSGCAIKKLYLKQNLYEVKLSNITVEMSEHIKQAYGDFAESMEHEKREMIVTFKRDDERELFLDWKKEQEQYEPRLTKVKAEKFNRFAYRKNRAVHIAMRLSFFTSNVTYHDKVLLLYNNSSAITPELMNSILTYLKYHFPMLRMGLTKKGNSINIFLNQGRIDISDQFQMDLELKRLYKVYAPPLHHSKVIAFRKYNSDSSLRQLSEWRDDIRDLFEDIGEVVDESDIKLHSYCTDMECQKSRPQLDFKKKRQRDCDEHTTEIHSHVMLYDKQVVDRFVREYDGRTGILGTEKIHITYQQKQSVIRVPADVYSIFRQKFVEQEKKLQRQFRDLTISQRNWWTFNKKMRRIDKYMFIDCASPSRESIFTASAKIREVFASYVIQLKPEVVAAINRNVLSDVDSYIYEGIFSRVEVRFDMEICFEYFGMKSEIKVYCSKQRFPLVEEAFQEQLKKVQVSSVKVDYRGRNIRKVQEIIKQFGEELETAISFCDRCIHVSGPLNKISQLRQLVEKLDKSEKHTCQICFDTLQLPTRLLNCQHSYCTSCLVNYVRNIKQDMSKYPLMCPDGMECGEAISLQDLRLLLDYDELYRACDRGVQKLIDNVHYHSCLTSNCQQLFQTAQTKADGNSFECPMCNLTYCMNCKNARHKGITCDKAEKISAEKLSKEEMERLSIRACRHCGQGIQKTQGCPYVKCLCGAKFCWECNLMFGDQEELEAHTSDKCRSILEGQLPD